MDPISNDPSMTSNALDYGYRYPYASALMQRTGRPLLRLAASASPHPYFFAAKLRHARVSAALLLLIGEISRTRFYTPPHVIAARMRAADPVVTSHGNMLRFEVFSRCAGVYGRVDLPPDTLEVGPAGAGTTNVDFNPGMRKALSSVRDADDVEIAVGDDGIAFRTDDGEAIERRVALPVRWVRGFGETQVIQARMEPRIELDALQAIDLLRSLPATARSDRPWWIVPLPTGTRLSRIERPGAVRAGGIDRLRPLQKVALHFTGAEIHQDPVTRTTSFTFHSTGPELQVTLSADAQRGFSGEGQLLSSLSLGAHPDLVLRTHAALRWDRVIAPERLAARLDCSELEAGDALAVLGSQGLVGFDNNSRRYFHRELPFAAHAPDEHLPRLARAQALVEAAAVRIVEQESGSTDVAVLGSSVQHRVRLECGQWTCTCPWFAKHGMERGPCAHVLAAQLHREACSR